ISRLIAVMAAGTCREIGKNLLMQGVDGNFRYVDLAAGLLLPMRYMIFQSVADGRLQNHDVDRGSFKWFFLQEVDSLFGDRRFVGCFRSRIDQIFTYGESCWGHTAQQGSRNSEFRSLLNKMTPGDPSLKIPGN